MTGEESDTERTHVLARVFDSDDGEHVGNILNEDLIKEFQASEAFDVEVLG